MDTTAAGDTFTGYFVSGFEKGTGLQKNISYSSCAAAISVSRNGAAPSIPVSTEVKCAISKMQPCEETIKSRQTKRLIENLIENNIATASVFEISSKLGYSCVYTGKVIKNLFGVTYKELLIEKRLNMANDLLINSDLSISEIIKKVGYENEGYFRKKFTQKFGKKPLEYRKILGEL